MIAQVHNPRLTVRTTTTQRRRLQSRATRVNDILTVGEFRSRWYASDGSQFGHRWMMSVVVAAAAAAAVGAD